MNSRRFLYISGPPGSGKSQVLLELAVWADIVFTAEGPFHQKTLFFNPIYVQYFHMVRIGSECGSGKHLHPTLFGLLVLHGLLVVHTIGTQIYVCSNCMSDRLFGASVQI